MIKNHRLEDCSFLNSYHFLYGHACLKRMILIARSNRHIYIFRYNYRCLRQLNMNNYLEGLVSIVTPMYNSGKFIAATLDSVIAQTYAHWEMIVVDDFSTDDGCSIVSEYVKKDSRIKLITSEKKSENGPIDVRNRAIKEAQGQYIAFLDSDDCWDEMKLEKQLQYINIHGSAFVYSDYRIFNENKQKISSVFRAPAKISYRDLCKVNSIGCLTVLYDVSKLGKIFIVDAPKREDLATWLYILKMVDFAYNVGECLATYRVHNNSFSSKKIELIRYQWHVYRKNEGFGVVKSLYYLIQVIIHKIFKY